MTTPAAPQPQQFVPLTELKITPEIRDAVNNALANRTPIIVAYVDEEGQPSLSFRGSTQVYSDTQLAIWVRNPEGGLQRALQKNNRITLFYRDPEKRITLQFRGRGHIENDPKTRETVYNNAPEPERNADREQRGFPLIIDLHQVDGVMPGVRVQMRP
ncbi:MAG TPA: pyridoxamine 5'-phosphate oxidase family protein [Dehalococcoidia bacterium]|nr:pyridoxamine 5'-phosphate oxidase family protein [Dehalococcoidia bacterium]